MSVMPNLWDRVVVTRRGRFRPGVVGEPNLVLRTADERRWGAEGLLNLGALELGIIVGVRRVKPSIKIDGSDALGVPYSRVVYETFQELFISCVFLSNEAPDIGDFINLLEHGSVPGGVIPLTAFRITEVEETWAEGQFCAANLSLSETSSFTSATPLTAITSLG